MKVDKLIKKAMKKITKLTDKALKTSSQDKIDKYEQKIQIVRNYIDSLVDIKRNW